ncbi:hypothetical protein PY38_00215, partial [Staphylococcus aureus]
GARQLLSHARAADPALDRDLRPHLLPVRPVMADRGDTRLAGPPRAPAADDAGHPPDGGHQPDGRDAGRASGRARQSRAADACLWGDRRLALPDPRDSVRQEQPRADICY